MKILMIIPMLLFLLPACDSRNKVISEDYPWPVSEVSEADSLLVKFERMRSSGNFTKPERRAVVERFAALSDSLPDNQMLRMRQLYMETCTLMRAEERRALQTLTAGMAQLDSAASPYDWFRLRSLSLSYEKSIYRRYMIAWENAKYFEKTGSDIELGRNLVVLANQLCLMSEAAQATSYYDRAETLFRKRNSVMDLYRTELNRGDPAVSGKSREILTRLLNDTIIRRDPHLYAIILHNSYLAFDSLPLVDRAIGILEDEPVDKGNLPLLYSLKSAHYLHAGDIDSALMINAKINAIESGNLFQTRDCMFVHYNMANVYCATGMKDSCINELNRVIIWSDSLQNETNLLVGYAHESKARIEAVERNAKLEKRSMVMGWMISVLILLLMILIIYFRAKRRKSQREYELRKLDDKIENGKQVQLAQSAVMEECDHMIEEINAVLEAHSGQHQSDAGLVSDVRRVMQYYRSNEESRKGFLKINRELDNRFTMRLKEDYPDMSESLLRLAALIAAGADSSQLASILNISHKSVYTSRYRLRSQLGLSKEDSLEDFLRKYS